MATRQGLTGVASGSGRSLEPPLTVRVLAWPGAGVCMQRCLEGAWGLPFGEKGLQGFPPREERSLSASHTSEDGEQRSRPPLSVMLAVAAGNLVTDTPRRHGLAGLPRPSSEAGPLRQELGLLKERPAEPTLSRQGKHYTLVPGPSAASEDLFCAGPGARAGFSKGTEPTGQAERPCAASKAVCEPDEDSPQASPNPLLHEAPTLELLCPSTRRRLRQESQVASVRIPQTPDIPRKSPEDSTAIPPGTLRGAALGSPAGRGGASGGAWWAPETGR